MLAAGEKAVPAVVSGPVFSIHINQYILQCAMFSILLSLTFFNLLSNAVNEKELSPKTMHTSPHKVSGMTFTTTSL